MNQIQVSINTDGGPLFPTKDSPPVRPFHQATLYNAVLGQLIGADSAGSFYPQLISQYTPLNTDYSKWQLTLKKNLQFHNGRKVGAEDLEFSIIRHLLSSHNSAEMTLWKKLKSANQGLKGKTYRTNLLPSIKIIDSLSVIIEFMEPVPNLPDWLVMSELSLVPREELEEDYFSWKSFPIGAGAYRIISCEGLSKSIDLKKWESSYLLPENAVEYYKINNELTPSTDLAIGFEQIPSNYSLTKLVLDIPFSIKGIFFNYKNKLAQKKTFRKFIADAVNRNEFIRNSSGRTQATSIIPQGKLGHAASFTNTKTPAPNSNLNETRFSITFRPRFFPETDFNLLMDQLRSGGFNVGILRDENPVFSENDSPFELVGLIPDCNDPLVTFSVFQAGEFWIPYLENHDSEYERLYKRALAEQVNDIRGKHYLKALEKLSKHFMEELYAIPLYEEKVFYFINFDKIKTISSQWQRQTFNFEKVETKK